MALLAISGGKNILFHQANKYYVSDILSFKYPVVISAEHFASNESRCLLMVI